MDILGIDVGGSGIKGALVNSVTGELVSDRHRIPTPSPSTPEAVIQSIAELVKILDYHGPIGCGFPALIKNGFIKTAANIDKSWINVDTRLTFAPKLGLPFYVVNDADAAGMAEVMFGAGKDFKGVILLLTIGTGIGSAFFTNGVLLPNTELGHIKMFGKSAEKYCSDAVRTKKKLSWKEWAFRFNEYVEYMEFLFSPDLIILGGGASKKWDSFNQSLRSKAPIVPAMLRNNAGIIGAAAWALSKIQEEARPL